MEQKRIRHARRSAKLRQLACGAVFLLLANGPAIALETNSLTELQPILTKIKSKYAQLAKRQQGLATPAKDLSPAITKVILPSPATSSIELATANDITTDSRFAIDEELIFSVYLAEYYLGDVYSLNSRQGVRIGLSEFAHLVDFAIEVDIEKPSAEGWFISQQNHFSLTPLSSGDFNISIGQKNILLSKAELQVSDDLYIELSDLASWFDFQWQLDEGSLVITINSQRTFPIEQRLSRKNRKLSQGQGFSKSVLPLKPNDYKLFSVPLLDLQAGLRLSSGDHHASYSLLSSQDTAFFNSQLFVNGNNSAGVTDARLTFGRRSTEAKLLGPLRATEYAFGDIVPVNSGAGATQGLGRGFKLNNLTNKLADNRRVNLDGEVQVGWDIELFRNGILIDKRINVSNGRYQFNDLELGFGENNFELVFYGPRGEIERREEHFYVDSNLIDAGESNYQLSVSENNTSVFAVNDPDDDPTRNGQTINATFNYGLTNWLSLGAGSSLFYPQQGDKQRQFSLRGDFVLGSLGLMNSILQLDENRRRRMLHSFRTNYAGINWNFNYSREELLDNELQATQASDSTETYRVNMDGSLFTHSYLPLIYRNTWSRSNFASGNSLEQFVNQMGVNSRWGSLSNDLIWRQQTLFNAGNNSAQPRSTSLSGSLAWRARIGKVHTRLFSSYFIEPSGKLNNIGTSLNYALSHKLSSELRYAHDLNNNTDDYSLRINWFNDAFSLTGIGNYHKRKVGDDWSFSLNARMSLGYEPETGAFFASGRSLSQSGALVVRAFDDLNLDNHYNAGEPVLDNVKVHAVQAFRYATTDKDGVAVIKAIPAGQTTDIVIDTDFLPDANMTVATEAFAVQGRKGSVQQFDVAVVHGGEVEGMLYLRDDSGHESALPYARVHLVDNNGNVKYSIRSEFDGYFLFTQVYPGNYFIQVDNSSGKQQGTTPVRIKQVKVSNRGDILSDIEFVLRKLESVQGYAASIGKFSSLGMLKVYLNLVKSRVNTFDFDDVFYYQNKEQNSYTLGIGFADQAGKESAQAMQQLCQTMATLDVNCKVDLINLNY